MPTFTLAPEDLPSEFGLLFFDYTIGQSLQEADDDRPPLPVVACLWGKVSIGNTSGAARPGVWLSFYTDAQQVRDEAMAYYADDPDALDRLMASHARRGPLIYDDEAVLLFGSQDVQGEVAGKTHRYYLIRCAWLLMQQAIATVSTERADRPTRRRLARTGIEAAPVRVVRLRHASSGDSDGNGSGRDFHHRWVVRGHWRKQWYPKQERHVPIWISPHVKGPEGAPMLGGEKVYVWER